MADLKGCNNLLRQICSGRGRRGGGDDSGKKRPEATAATERAQGGGNEEQNLSQQRPEPRRLEQRLELEFLKASSEFQEVSIRIRPSGDSIRQPWAVAW